MMQWWLNKEGNVRISVLSSGLKKKRLWQCFGPPTQGNKEIDRYLPKFILIRLRFRQWHFFGYAVNNKFEDDAEDDANNFTS